MPNFVLRRYPALGYPLYRRYWLASFASVGATQLITLGQGWLVFDGADRPEEQVTTAGVVPPVRQVADGELRAFDRDDVGDLETRCLDLAA